ncbi:hypothetical protein B6N60_00764 [Richelia sinica FACHB-800]|uniref:DUF2203 domain-containing protein n=1 Tax=Richelia sinica FACHB-800 TaxID=1357546 RepID=A0A975T4R5_9NOST|nr:hypothetical protein [Richelia sinica]MBD2663202.1 hypothetical protein [Richelia sinica FACHB-800]QXE22084.1 hypothetical protein B6N60_00764 [Richelia sinica FACHB-800]
MTKPEASPEPSFEQELADVDHSLVLLKERYAQVLRDQQQQAQWQQELKNLQQNKHQTPEMKAELKRLQKQLEVLEINLESQLFSWSSVKRPFWQAVRFGGLGVVIGWLLRAYVG